MVKRTVYELIEGDWLAAGNDGRPSVEFARTWRLTFPLYGKWPLGTSFESGSTLPGRPATSLDMATKIFCESFPDAKFPPDNDADRATLESLVDEIREYEDATAPGGDANTAGG